MILRPWSSSLPQIPLKFLSIPETFMFLFPHVSTNFSLNPSLISPPTSPSILTFLPSCLHRLLSQSLRSFPHLSTDFSLNPYVPSLISPPTSPSILTFLPSSLHQLLSQSLRSLSPHAAIHWVYFSYSPSYLTVRTPLSSNFHSGLLLTVSISPKN